MLRCDAGVAACTAAGAQRVVVDALSIHKDDAAVCGKGCAALAQMSEFSDAASIDACVAAGAPQAVVDALSFHKGDAAVCEKGCAALAGFAGSGAGTAACMDASAPLALAAALTAFQGESAVCLQASAALMLIARSGPKRREAVKACAVAPLAAALARDPDIETHEWSHAALKELGYFGEGKELPSAEMDAARVVALMGACDADVGEACAAAGVAALCAIFERGGGEEERCAPGVVGAVVAQFDRHPNSSAVCAAASAFLLHLAEGAAPDQRKKDIVAAGAVPHLASAQRRHPAARSNAQKALKALGFHHNGKPDLSARGTHVLGFFALLLCYSLFSALPLRSAGILLLEFPLLAGLLMLPAKPSSEGEKGALAGHYLAGAGAASLAYHIYSKLPAGSFAGLYFFLALVCGVMLHEEEKNVRVKARATPPPHTHPRPYHQT